MPMGPITRESHPSGSGSFRIFRGENGDLYGAPLSQFVLGQGYTGSGGVEAEPDLASAIAEFPEVLTGANGAQTVLVPRIRAHTAVIGADVHLSPENTTYTSEGNDGSVMNGGILDGDLPADGEMEFDVGPEFTMLGPDIGSVLDLSSEVTAWRKGQQLVYAVNGSGESEIMFLERVENVSGDTRGACAGSSAPATIRARSTCRRERCSSSSRTTTASRCRTA